MKTFFGDVRGASITVWGLYWFPCRRVRKWRGRKFVIRRRLGWYE